MISSKCKIAFSMCILQALLCLPGDALAELPENNPARLPPVPLNEMVLNVPGDPLRPVTLEVTFYKPEGAGPFPLVVLNHGATHKSSNIRSPDERSRFSWPVLYFLSRGYAVALPMMRGFSGSGGAVEQDGCDLQTMGLHNARDIEAVISYFKSHPSINGRQIIVAGQSYGGLNALHMELIKDPDVKGIISFSGGIRISSCNYQEKSMVYDFAFVGSGAKIPVLFFYGDNDSLFPKYLWQSMYDSYTKAGGKAELVAYGTFKDDSHQLLSYREGLDIWVPKVDKFLTEQGMPSQLLYPQYLPSQPPLPSGYAKIDDVQAVPYLNERGRETYRKYLNMPVPKALAIFPNGSIFAEIGGFDPLTRVRNKCLTLRNQCELYAVDNNVVWVKSKTVVDNVNNIGVAEKIQRVFQPGRHSVFGLEGIKSGDTVAPSASQH